MGFLVISVEQDSGSGPKVLTVAAGSSATTGGTAAVTQAHALSASAASSATVGSTPAVTQQHALTVAGASTATTASTPAITQTAPATNLTVADTSTATSGGALAIIQQHALSVAGGTSAVAASTVAITQDAGGPAPVDLLVSPGASATFLDDVAITLPGEPPAPPPPPVFIGGAGPNRDRYMVDAFNEAVFMQSLTAIAAVSGLVATGYI